MTHIGLEHSDYISYIDESGDHSLTSIDEGKVSGYGFHLYPLKSEEPQGSP